MCVLCTTWGMRCGCHSARDQTFKGKNWIRRDFWHCCHGCRGANARRAFSRNRAATPRCGERRRACRAPQLRRTVFVPQRRGPASPARARALRHARFSRAASRARSRALTMRRAATPARRSRAIQRPPHTRATWPRGARRVLPAFAPRARVVGARRASARGAACRARQCGRRGQLIGRSPANFAHRASARGDCAARAMGQTVVIEFVCPECNNTWEIESPCANQIL